MKRNENERAGVSGEKQSDGGKNLEQERELRFCGGEKKQQKATGVFLERKGRLSLRRNQESRGFGFRKRRVEVGGRKKERQGRFFRRREPSAEEELQNPNSKLASFFTGIRILPSSNSSRFTGVSWC